MCYGKILILQYLSILFGKKFHSLFFIFKRHLIFNTFMISTIFIIYFASVFIFLIYLLACIHHICILYRHTIIIITMVICFLGIVKNKIYSDRGASFRFVDLCTDIDNHFPIEKLEKLKDLIICKFLFAFECSV